MSSPRLEQLLHILDEARYLREASLDLDARDFIADETLRRAFVRSLEIIGEAAKHVPREIVDSSPEIEWKAMAGMRDRLIDGYFGVDYDLVWDVVKNKVPEMAKRVSLLLRALEDQPS